jgi:hypothetical protein
LATHLLAAGLLHGVGVGARLVIVTPVATIDGHPLGARTTEGATAGPPRLSRPAECPPTVLHLGLPEAVVRVMSLLQGPEGVVVLQVTYSDGACEGALGVLVGPFLSNRDLWTGPRKPWSPSEPGNSWLDGACRWSDGRERGKGC